MWNKTTAGARTLAAAALILLSSSFLPFATAQANDACFACHEKQPEDGSYMPIIRAARYAKSVHAKMPCEDCHKKGQDDGFEVVPHVLETQEPPTCQECHAEEHAAVVAEFERSAHNETISKTFPCSRCHNVHTMLADVENADRDERMRQANGPCIECHSDTVVRVAGLEGAAGITMAHAFLPNAEKHVRMRCIVCHTPVEQEGIHDVRPKAESERECAACHTEDSAYVGKFIGEDDRSTWVTNPVLFEYAYVPGATRNRLADKILLGLLGLTILGVLGHAILRIATRKEPEGPHRVEKVYMYGIMLRLGHWLNAALIIVLIATGMRIHFGTRAEPFLDFETAFNVHNLVGAALVLVGALFYVSTIASGDLRQYLKWHPGMLGELMAQIRWYLGGIFTGAPKPSHATPERRFNALQQVTYAGLMFVAYPAIIVSGVMLLFPDIFRGEGGTTGIWWVATLHYLLGFGFLLFLVGHLYLITIGDRASYGLTSMLSGWHRHHVPVERETTEKSPSSDAGDTSAQADETSA